MDRSYTRYGDGKKIGVRHMRIGWKKSLFCSRPSLRIHWPAGHHSILAICFMIADATEMPQARDALTDYGLAIRWTECQQFDTNLAGIYQWCPLARK